MGHPGKYLPQKLDPSDKFGNRSMKRTTQNIQGFVLQNTANGLIECYSAEGVPQGLSLPRDTEGIDVDITALRSTDQLIRSAGVSQQESINNEIHIYVTPQGQALHILEPCIQMSYQLLQGL